jgi:hypothetical protein
MASPSRFQLIVWLMVATAAILAAFCSLMRKGAFQPNLMEPIAVTSKSIELNPLAENSARDSADQSIGKEATTHDHAGASNPTTPPVAINALTQQSNLPPHIESLLQSPSRYPKVEDLLALRPRDVDILLAQYRAQAEVTNRVALALALSATGSRKALDALIHTLSVEYAGVALSGRGPQAMQSTVRAIGVIAEKDDEAFSFLVAHTDPSSWRQAGFREWTAGDGLDDYMDDAMARVAVLSLGLSGRPEAVDILRGLARKETTNLESVAGSIVEGMFHASFIATHGREEFWRKFLAGTAYADEFARWVQDAEEGRHWLEWMRQIDGTQGGSSADIP